ncbi:MAG: hypothetical protein AAB546_00555 [Patescibacteria group bacterium]
MNKPLAQVAKYTSTPSASSWGQVHDFTPTDQDKLIKRGRLVAIISITGLSGGQIESINVGREILTRLHEEYFGEIATPAFESLKTSIENVCNEFSNDQVKTSIGALAILADSLVFAASQHITGFVLRQGSLAKIIDSQAGFFSGSGNIFPNDTFLLATSDYFEKMSEGIIKACLEKPSAQAIIESLTPFVYDNNTSHTFVACVVKFATPIANTEAISFFPHQTPEVLGIKKTLVDFIDSLIAKIPERRVIVRPDLADMDGRNRKSKVLLIGGVLLFILLVSIVFGSIQRANKLARSRYEDRLITAVHQLEEAKTLATINQARARELLLAARQTLNDIKTEGVKDNQVESTLSEINSNIGQIAGIYEVNPELYLDLSLLSQGLRGDDISISEGRMLILDRQGKLVSVAMDSKKTRVLAGPERLSNAQFTAVYADRNFVLTDSSVVEILGTTKTAIDKDWDKAAGMHAFAANIYILDKGKNAIWRYSGSDAGFGSQNNWFAPGINVDLSGVAAWSIDGSIWLLTSKGEIEKYTNGNPQNFVMSGLEGDIAGSVDIFSDDTTQYLYVLDKNKGRIIVLDKTGGYKAEYVSDQIKQSSKLVVSEEDKKIILLVSDKLYEILIKHL